MNIEDIKTNEFLRLDFKRDEILEFLKILRLLEKEVDDCKESSEFQKALKLFQNVKRIELTSSKKFATKIASDSKVKNSKLKVDSIINKMEKNQERITIYSVSKKAKMSYNTVKKYIPLKYQKAK